MRHCYVVRVFTVGTEGGNPLGVIPDSTGLSDADMQAIAARLGFSESVFVFWRDGASVVTTDSSARSPMRPGCGAGSSST